MHGPHAQPRVVLRVRGAPRPGQERSQQPDQRRGVPLPPRGPHGVEELAQGPDDVEADGEGEVEALGGGELED